MIQEQIDIPKVGHEIYNGLNWKESGSSKTSHKVHALSDTTRTTYVIEQGAGNLWCLRHGYQDAPGRPNILLGQYADKDVAKVAAERHDYRYWSATADRAGLKCVFMGSKGLAADFIASLPEDERDESTDMLVEEFTLKDGRPFSAAASFFTGIKAALKQEKNGKFSLTLLIDGEDTPLWMMQAAMGAEITMGAVETAKSQSEEWIERGKQAIRRAAVLPCDNSFQGWMQQRYDRWGLVKTAMTQNSEAVELAVAETLRRIIGCPTRRELLTNRDAIMKLERLDREFYTDLSKGTR